MDTPLVEYCLSRTVGGNDTQKLIEARNAALAMGYMGDAWDVAHAALFLASDKGRCITATEIIVDGGSIAAMPYSLAGPMDTPRSVISPFANE